MLPDLFEYAQMSKAWHRPTHTHTSRGMCQTFYHFPALCGCVSFFWVNVLECLHKLFRCSACYLKITVALYRSACTETLRRWLYKHLEGFGAPSVKGCVSWRQRSVQKNIAYLRVCVVRSLSFSLGILSFLAHQTKGIFFATAQLMQTKDQERKPPSVLLQSI